jgi:DNA-binding protein YbaB
MNKQFEAQKQFLDFQRNFRPKYNSDDGKIIISLNGKLEIMELKIEADAIHPELIENIRQLINYGLRDAGGKIQVEFQKLNRHLQRPV